MKQDVLHEHGVLARFRYSDLKEAARAADAGPMQIEWREGAALRCAEAVQRSTTDDTNALGSWLNARK